MDEQRVQPLASSARMPGAPALMAIARSGSLRLVDRCISRSINDDAGLQGADHFGDLGTDVAAPIGHLFRARYFKSLPLFNRLDKKCRFQHGFMRARVQPS